MLKNCGQKSFSQHSTHNRQNLFPTSFAYLTIAVVSIDISKIIGELLNTHECVIVPDLGGFLAHRKSASWGENGVLLPPKQTLSFNSRLTKNDGILAHHIAQQHGIGYTDALNKIEKYVAAAKSLMASGEEVALPNIGTLSFDEEHNLQFHLSQSFESVTDFGFRKIFATPVEKVEAQKAEKVAPVVAQTSRQKTISFRNAERRKRRISLLKYSAVVMLAVLLISGFAGLIMLQNNPQFSNVSEATLLPFKDSSTETRPVIEKPELTASTPADEALPALPPAAAEQPIEEKKTETSGYYVIVGAFANAENAEAKFNELHSDLGSDVPLLKTNRNALTVVGFYASGNYRDAVKVLHAAKEKETKVWLLKVSEQSTSAQL